MDSPGETAPALAKSPAPFLSETSDLLEAPAAAAGAASWTAAGAGLVVSSPDDLSRRLLPRCFKHRNFSTFIRQLNTYGFRKAAAADRWEFRLEKFRRGRRREPSVCPSFLKAWEGGRLGWEEQKLVEENRVLREENSSLLVEIGYYRSLESELMERLSQSLRTKQRSRFSTVEDL